jgi:hypothetical protein
MNVAQYGDGYPGPLCFKSITIWYGGKTAQATIMDKVSPMTCYFLFAAIDSDAFFSSAWGAHTAGLTSLRVSSVTLLLRVMASFTDRGGSMMTPATLHHPRAPNGRRFLVLIGPRLLTHPTPTIPLTQTPLPASYPHPKLALHRQANLPLL